MNRILLLTMLVLLSALPAPSYAATVGPFSPIIPPACQCKADSVAGMIATAPDYGCVLETVQGGIRLIINFGFILAILALMYAGFLWMTSASNPGNHGKAKQLLLNVFVGIAIMLTSWLIVDFVMKTFYKEEDTRFGPWNSILADRTGGACLRVNRNPLQLTTGGLDVREGQAPAPGTGTGSLSTGNVCTAGQPSTSCAIVGDSLAQGTGQSFRSCSQNALQNRSAEEVLRNTPSTQVDWVVISAGANNCPRQDSCQSDAQIQSLERTLQSIRSTVRARQVVWIVPANNARAAAAVNRVKSANAGDQSFTFTPGNDGVHPPNFNYSGLANSLKVSLCGR